MYSLIYMMYGGIYFYFYTKIKNRNIFNKENIVFLPIFLYTMYVPLQFTLLKFNNIIPY